MKKLTAQNLGHFLGRILPPLLCNREQNKSGYKNEVKTFKKYFETEI